MRLVHRPSLSALVAVLMSSGSAYAQAISVNLASPTAGQATGDVLNVVGTAQSQFALSEAIATVQAATGPLVISNATMFTGTLDISGVPIGPQTLTVTVKDAFGTTGSTQISLIHDRPPAVSVVSPLDRSVARPAIRLAASCVDLDMYGCASITAVAGTTQLASGTTAFDQVVSLASFEGQRVNVFFTATDTAGMSTTVTRTVFVDSSPRLFEVDAVGGQILDVDASRILYTANDALRIRTRGTQNDITVLASGAPSIGWLTLPGALWNATEWNGTQAVPLPEGQWVANGNTACGVLPSSADRGTGVVRDLTTGVTTTAFPASEGLYASCADVAANGDVIIQRVDGTAMQAYRYRAGALTRVSDGTNKTRGALSDGTNVVYEYYHSGSTAGTRLFTAGNEVMLGGPGGVLSYEARAHYAVAAGAAAFVDFAAGDPLKVFLRSPAGLISQVGAFATNTHIDWGGHGNAVTQGNVIHDDTVSVINGGKRYLAKPGIPPDLISSSLGGARYVGSDWHVVIGRSVFKVVPPGFDAGAPDAGAEDAGPLDAGVTDGSALDAGVHAPPGDDAAASAGDASTGADVDGDAPGDGASVPGDASGHDDDDGGCSASRRGRFGAGLGPALLAMFAVLRLVRRRPRR